MEKKEIKVSVIMPAYNVAPYVQKALRSIMNQTLKEIEIIVINDGSTDNTLEIVEAQAASDERVQVVSIHNQGQSVARNVGFYMASGKYIYFFDSDDLLEENALELCYKKCEAESLDIVFFDADVFSDLPVSPIAFDYRRANKYEDRTYIGTDILSLQLDSLGFSASVCLMMINKAFLQNLRLFFYPHVIHEDELFTFILYLNAKRVGLIDSVFFHRRVRGNSTMTTPYGKRNAIGILTVCRELKKYYLEYGRTQSERKLLKKDISILFSALWINVNRYLDKPEQDYLNHVFSHEFARYVGVRTFLRVKCPRLFLFLSSVKRMLK